jgi:hypothetical protein
VYVSRGRFANFQQKQACSGDASPVVDVLEPTAPAGVIGSVGFGDGAKPNLSPHGSAAYDPIAGELLVIWSRSYEGGIRGWRFSPTQNAHVGTSFELVQGAPSGGHDATGIVYDGTGYGVVIVSRVSYNY